MATGRRVLITGISGDLSSLLAQRLERDERVAAIAGIDLAEPQRELSRTEYVRSDLSSPGLPRAIESLRIDTLVHLAITAEPHQAGGRSRMKEQNVIRTMQLLGAAQQASRLRRMVVKSTTAVYGSSYADPALLREDVAPSANGGSGYAKDAVEVESYARAFGRRRADVTLSIMRFANFIGGGVGSLIGSYLRLPVLPTVLGYDPRVQLCHGFDAVSVLQRAVTEDHPGIYNVAGSGVVYLSQLARLAGKPTVAIPRPLVGTAAGWLRRSGAVDFSPEQIQVLLYGRVGDITRLREQLGYLPRFSTRSALEEFLREQRVEPLVHPTTVERVERGLAGLLGSSVRRSGRGRDGRANPMREGAS